MVNDQNGRLEVKLIDFGLIHQIIGEDGRHVINEENVGVKGTFVYMSRAAHQGKKLSRRDDLESLCYVIRALVFGSLPWHKEDKDTMLKMKTEWFDNENYLLCQGLPEIFKKFV